MKDQLVHKIKTAREHLEPLWLDDTAVEEWLIRFQKRLHRRRMIRIAVMGTVPIVVVLLVAGALGWFGPTPSWLHPGAATSAQRVIVTTIDYDPSRPASTIQFVDGSTATALNENTQIVATEVSPTNIRVCLGDGAARFDVTPRPERLFQVEAGDVTVLVLGTVFSVFHLSRKRVEVVVERGRVRVGWQDGAQALSANESGIFPPFSAPASGNEDSGRTESRPESRHSSGTVHRAQPSLPEQPSWQTLAERDQCSEAYTALQRAGGAATLHAMEDSLLAADVMRRCGHASEAAETLERAIAAHPSDPRASVAAFTLGRVLLHQVGQPRAAADAFRQARRLSPHGALAEDAMAREVEALSRAGLATAAQQLAREYIQQYPQGRRIRAVRRHGGLE